MVGEGKRQAWYGLGCVRRNVLVVGEMEDVAAVHAVSVYSMRLTTSAKARVKVVGRNKESMFKSSKYKSKGREPKWAER